MASLNKAVLIGRLGADCEMRYTAGGDPVATFNLATEEKWKDKSGEKQSKTSWHRCIAWRRLAEIANEYLKKGSLIYCEGRIEYREYDGKDGVKRKVAEINLTSLQMLSGTGKTEGNGQTSKSSESHEEGFTHEEDDDIRM